MTLRCAVLAVALVLGGGASARPVLMPDQPSVVQNAQYSRGEMLEIRKCMRRTYGRHYFRGVRQQYRMAMLAACDGR